MSNAPVVVGSKQVAKVPTWTASSGIEHEASLNVANQGGMTGPAVVAVVAEAVVVVVVVAETVVVVVVVVAGTVVVVVAAFVVEGGVSQYILM